MEIAGQQIAQAAPHVVGGVRGRERLGETGRSVSERGRIERQPVVVDPHHGEGHEVGVRCLEKSLLERLVHGRFAVIPVRVPDQRVEPVIGGQSVVDLPGRRQRLVQGTQQRLAGLAMSRPPRPGAAHDLVLGPAGRILTPVVSRGMPERAGVRRNLDVLTRYHVISSGNDSTHRRIAESGTARRAAGIRDSSRFAPLPLLTRLCPARTRARTIVRRTAELVASCSMETLPKSIDPAQRELAHSCPAAAPTRSRIVHDRDP